LGAFLQCSPFFGGHHLFALFVDQLIDGWHWSSIMTVLEKLNLLLYPQIAVNAHQLLIFSHIRVQNSGSPALFGA
jgi:hypothetical protein